MLDYRDALQAFKGTFKTGKIIEGYDREFIATWCYGWLTAKGVPCSQHKLFNRIKDTDQIR